MKEYQEVQHAQESKTVSVHSDSKANQSRVQSRHPMQLMANSSQRIVQLRSMQQLADTVPVQRAFNNTGLPDNLKSGIENLSGYSMNDVKVHYNSDKPAQLNAHAYAQGSAIHVAPGQEKHLPHEAWHVVQQKQGRVQATKQLKGKVAINDDAGLEREADVMGAKANSLETIQNKTQNTVLNNQNQQFDSPIQAKFIKLSEEKILFLVAEAKKKDEDLDAEYLQGLYISDSEVDSPDPKLYIEVMKVAHPIFTGKLELGSKVKIFTVVDEADYGEDTVFSDLTESKKITTKELVANASRFISKEEGTKIFHDLAFSILTGGVDDSAGGYGTIEFRFKATKGDVYVPYGYDKDSSIFKESKDLRIVEESRIDIERYKSYYIEANLPYPKERIGPDFLFIEESLIEDFSNTILEIHMGGIIPRETASTLAKPTVGVKLPDAPIQVPKTRKKEYTYRAPRGSRDAGQKAAMSNFSAYDYVKRFSTKEADSTSWEWLHIQGSRLGGPNRPENLVAGTAEANTHMIPYERAIFELSTVATNQKPVEVVWNATVRKDEDGTNTHVGDEITIDVKFPKGEPDETEHVKPNRIINIFPGKFQVSEKSTFTKSDRDLLDSKKR
jgi:Domain of unknown function (DUF4157)